MPGIVGKLGEKIMNFLTGKRLLGEVLLGKEIEKFYLVLGGHIFFQCLSAAVRFDLFTLLSEHKRLTLPEIAGRLGIQEKPARILLLGLTSVGFLRKKGPYYSNSRLAETILTKNSVRNVCSYVDLEHFIVYKPMFHFFKSLKEGKNIGLCELEGDEPTIYERLKHNRDLEKIFHDAMHDLSVQANEHLAGRVDFSDVKQLLDVGGGDGTNIIRLAKEYPQLRAAVFDLPSVVAIAQENIEANDLSDRLSVIPGNCWTDAFPKGMDCILLAHFFTIWSEEKDRQLLKKCYEALPRGGKVIIFNMLQCDNEKGPLAAAVGSPYFLTLATGEGMLYTGKEYEAWMKEAGFRTVKRRNLPINHAAIIGIK